MKIIDQIMIRHAEIMKDNREVPPFLQKQINGIYLAADDLQRGVQMIIDGLHDEKDQLDKLIEG